MDSFQTVISRHQTQLKKKQIDILQVNLGKLCNLACIHCHVEAGPTKTRENMSEDTADAVIRVMKQGNVNALDLTGGAPELNPNFKKLVRSARREAIHVLDRCNLTVFDEPGMSDVPEFLRDHQVEMIASLPCYSRTNVDQQRGKGVFDRSIEALLRLNRLGYGQLEGDLKLSLVYNPVGPHLPPAQAELEAQYKSHLFEDFGIVFNQLYCITNMPITRYAKYLKATNQYEAYVELLVHHFNPRTLDALMCTNTLSVAWDGSLYDCDFNQALNMKMRNGRALNIKDVTLDSLAGREILTGDHCFGCTAGCGSSCQGVLEQASDEVVYHHSHVE